MKIYHYDNDGIFLRESEARENPLEPGEYLVPANATRVRLPAIPEGSVALFSGGGWTLMEDPRGEWYSTATGAKTVLTSVTASTEGMTCLVPGDCEKWNGSVWVFDLDQYKSRKSAAIRARTSALILAGFDSVSKGKHFGMELTDQANWTALILVLDALTVSADSPFYIQDSNGLPVTFTSKDEIKACYTEGFARKASLLAADGQLEAQIAAASTLSQVDAVVDERT